MLLKLFMRILCACSTTTLYSRYDDWSFPTDGCNSFSFKLSNCINKDIRIRNRLGCFSSYLTKGEEIIVYPVVSFLPKQSKGREKGVNSRGKKSRLWIRKVSPVESDAFFLTKLHDVSTCNKILLKCFNPKWSADCQSYLINVTFSKWKYR